MGDDDTPIADVTLEMNIDRVAETIGKLAEPVVLVGHSLGGITITGVAERVPDRIGLLVYLTAFLPRDGESGSAIASSPAWIPEAGTRAIIPSADGLSVSFSPEGALERFYNGCSEADIAYCLPRLKPQPSIIRNSPVHTTPERFGSVPRAYVHCADDRSVALAVQQYMVEHLPCRETVTLQTGHSPFLSAPKELANALSNLADS